MESYKWDEKAEQQIEATLINFREDSDFHL